MDTIYWVPGSELTAGDTLLVHVAEDMRVSAEVEIVRQNEVLTVDFLREIEAYNWQSRAFNVTYSKRDNSFTFLAEIDGREVIDRQIYTKLFCLAGSQEINRRANYRLPYNFDVFLKSMNPERYLGRNDGKVHEVGFVRCQGIDISESGVGLASNHDWNQNEDVECRFEIDGEEYTFLAKVVRKLRRTEVDSGNDPYIYRLGIHFENENEKLLRKIRHFVFRQQIARKK